MSWIGFWGGFFVVSMIGYAALVLVVTIRGFDDLRRLLASKNDQE